MEMIAMLGGLGSSPYLDNPSAAARAALAAVSGAKKLDELAAINAGVPNMGLTNEEKLVVQAAIASKLADLNTPFYKRPLYWAVVAVVVGAAYYHWPKIKGAIGLSGAGDSWRKAFNPSGKLPGARPSAGYSREERFYAHEDSAIARIDAQLRAKREAARKARKAAKRAAKKAAKKGGR